MVAQLAVHHFTTKEGLPSNYVYSVFSDHQGFLWFGTDNGVARFDGKYFKVLTSMDGLADNEVFGVLEDTRKRLWLRTYSGKMCYLWKGKVFTQAQDSLLGEMELDSHTYSAGEFQDTIYLTSALGQLVKYFPGGVQRQPFLRWATLVSTPRGLFAVSPGTVVNMSRPSEAIHFNAPKSYAVRAAAVGNDLFCSSNSELRWINPSPRDSAVSYHTFSSPILYLGKASETSIYVATESGAYELHLDHHTLDTLLIGYTVSYIARDFEGGLWVTTLGDGVFYFSHSKSWLCGLAKPGKPHQEYLFGQSPVDSQWFCLGQNSDITFIDGKQTHSCPNAITSPVLGKVNSFFWVSEDSLLVTCERTGTLFIRSQQRFENSRIFRRNKLIQPISPDSLITSRGDGLYIEAIASVRRKIFNQGTDRPYARLRVNSAESMDGRVILGSNHGLWEMGENTVHPLFPGLELLHDRVNAMTPGTEGRLWIALANRGIVLWQGDEVYAPAPHFAIINVRKLRKGPDGALWACNHEGVFKFTLGDKGHYSRESFTPSHGYPLANTWDILPMTHDAYAATDQGLIRFESTFNDTPPRLIVEKVLYGQQQLTLDGSPHTSINRPGKRFKVSFAGVSFRNSGELSFRYRIPEIDGEWQHTTNREIEYPDMRFGDYHFEIKAVGTTGLESETYRLAFSIAPHFWQTSWFIGLCMLAVGMVAALGYRGRVRQLKSAHQRAQEKARAEIEQMEAELYVRELEQKAMRLQMNPHFIFNALNTIQGLYASKDIPKAKEYVSKLSTLIRQILEQSTYSSIHLEKELELMSGYLDVMQYRFEGLFSYRVTVAPDIALERILVPPLILQPIVENAVIHGIAPKGETGWIDVQVKREGQDIVISIQDNGIGIHKSQSQKTSPASKATSKGMKLTAERVHQHLQDKTDRFIVEEIMDEHLEIVGTRVTIRITEWHHI